LGVSIHVAERVLNHAREKIEATYDVHDYIDEKRVALDKWAAHLRTLLRSPDPQPRATGSLAGKGAISSDP
jgi:hypothetical protein